MYKMFFLQLITFLCSIFVLLDFYFIWFQKKIFSTKLFSFLVLINIYLQTLFIFQLNTNRVFFWWIIQIKVLLMITRLDQCVDFGSNYKLLLVFIFNILFNFVHINFSFGFKAFQIFCNMFKIKCPKI